KPPPIPPREEEQAAGQIPSRLNAMTARAESARTGKPMFVWEMNGHLLDHTEMPPKGKFKLIFAFVEANDGAGRSIPPSAAYMPEYHDSWTWLTPAASR